MAPGGQVLPFLKPKRMASTIMATRAADGTEKPPEDSSLAQKLMDAIHSKDVSALAAVLKTLTTEGPEDAA